MADVQLSEIPQSLVSSETNALRKGRGFFKILSYCLFSKCKPLKKPLLFLGKHNSATVNPDQIIFLREQRKHLCSFPGAYSFNKRQETKLIDSGLPCSAAAQRVSATKKRESQKTLFHPLFFLFLYHLAPSHFREEEAWGKRRKQNLEKTSPATKGWQIHICQITTNHFLNKMWVTPFSQIWSNSCPTLSKSSWCPIFSNFKCLKKLPLLCHSHTSLFLSCPPFLKYFLSWIV